MNFLYSDERVFGDLASFRDRFGSIGQPGTLEKLRSRLQRVREANLRNLGYFEAEVQKLDAWADGLKDGLENEVKELDREIKEVRRTALVSAALEDKLHWQKRQRELEGMRNQLRRRIFDRQDEIDGQRSRVIDEREGRLSRQERLTPVFTL